MNRALAVWVQLAEIFGNAFLREHGDEPGSLWVAGIHGLSDAQISRGLVNLVDGGLSFPPNLSQFMEACRRVPPSPQWVARTMIEDHRPRGYLSYSDWKKENGIG